MHSIATPVRANGSIIGYIVNYWTDEGDHGSFYVQRKRVRSGACVPYGINCTRMVQAGL